MSSNLFQNHANVVQQWCQNCPKMISTLSWTDCNIVPTKLQIYSHILKLSQHNWCLSCNDSTAVPESIISKSPQTKFQKCPKVIPNLSQIDSKLLPTSANCPNMISKLSPNRCQHCPTMNSKLLLTLLQNESQYSQYCGKFISSLRQNEYTLIPK